MNIVHIVLMPHCSWINYLFLWPWDIQGEITMLWLNNWGVFFFFVINWCRSPVRIVWLNWWLKARKILGGGRHDGYLNYLLPATPNLVMTIHFYLFLVVDHIIQLKQHEVWLTRWILHTGSGTFSFTIYLDYLLS